MVTLELNALTGHVVRHIVQILDTVQSGGIREATALTPSEPGV